MLARSFRNPWTIALATLATGFIAGLLLYPQARTLKHHLNTFVRGHGALYGPYDVALVGDSIAWSGRWQRLCPGRAFANYAEGGKSALLIKLRLPEFQNTSARRVFMLMGLSDAWQGRTADAIAADFRSIAETMKTGGREVTIVSVLLPNLEMRTRFLPDRPFDRAVIDALNARLPAVAREIGARFADVNSVLAPRGELLADFTYDGVHLTDEAYAVLARTIGICG